jgi:hypothetical protein
MQDLFIKCPPIKIVPQLGTRLAASFKVIFFDMPKLYNENPRSNRFLRVLPPRYAPLSLKLTPMPNCAINICQLYPLIKILMSKFGIIDHSPVERYTLEGPVSRRNKQNTDPFTADVANTSAPSNDANATKEPDTDNNSTDLIAPQQTIEELQAECGESAVSAATQANKKR